eukprot:Skav218066  [mRNA]  locus=scaffold1832:71287:76705:+ [translate_table: standard]
MRWLLLWALAAGPAAAKVVIEAMEHDIMQIQARSIGFHRKRFGICLWFFKDDGKEDGKFLDEYNKGMAKVCAINCNEYSVFCEKQGVKVPPLQLGSPAAVACAVQETPTVMIYPPNPALLFSNKKSVPLIWKVFKRTVKFGFVTEDQSDIVQRYKAGRTSLPGRILDMVVSQNRGPQKWLDTYTGELKFLPLKDWVNLHSESGMGDKVSSAGGAKEESVEVPELTAKSHQDVCFKGEGLCDGEATPAEIEMLTGLSKKYTSQLSDRGAKMKWMWMNLAIESAYKDGWDINMPCKPKRCRMHRRTSLVLRNSPPLQCSTLTRGGDARFTMVKGQKLPAWAQREAAASKKATGITSGSNYLWIIGDVRDCYVH